jgi:hypothetical protein
MLCTKQRQKISPQFWSKLQIHFSILISFNVGEPWDPEPDSGGVGLGEAAPVTRAWARG